MARSLICHPLSSQHEDVSQPDLHHPTCSVRLLTPVSYLPSLHVWESHWPEESGVSVLFLLFAIFTSISPFRREYKRFQGIPLLFSVQGSFFVFFPKQPGDQDWEGRKSFQFLYSLCLELSP